MPEQQKGHTASVQLFKTLGGGGVLAVIILGTSGEMYYADPYQQRYPGFGYLARLRRQETCCSINPRETTIMRAPVLGIDPGL